jgi:hypothetical protein
VEALSRPSLTRNSFDPMKELLERFGSMEAGKGGRGGAEALFVLQVRGLSGLGEEGYCGGGAGQVPGLFVVSRKACDGPTATVLLRIWPCCSTCFEAFLGTTLPCPWSKQ